MKNLLQEARIFADKAHKGQVDDDNLPFFQAHPEVVGDILKLLKCRDEVIAAGYLHDVLEDTEATYEQLKEKFGQEIADLVNEVTHEGNKSSGYYFPRLKSRDAIMIKLADRLSNISRMNSWSAKRREHYLNKTKFWKSE